MAKAVKTAGEGRWLSKRAVAERHGCSPRTVERRVRRGEFPAPRWLGGRSVWWSLEVEAWEAQGVTAAPTERKAASIAALMASRSPAPVAVEAVAP